MSIRSVRFFYPAATGPAPEELVINVSQVIGPNAQLELPVGLKGSINLWQVNKRYITLGQGMFQRSTWISNLRRWMERSVLIGPGLGHGRE